MGASVYKVSPLIGVEIRFWQMINVIFWCFLQLSLPKFIASLFQCLPVRLSSMYRSSMCDRSMRHEIIGILVPSDGNSWVHMHCGATILPSDIILI